MLTFETVGDSDVSAVRSLDEVLQGRRTKIDVIRDSEVSVVESLSRKRNRDSVRDHFVVVPSQPGQVSPTQESQSSWSPERQFEPFCTRPSEPLTSPTTPITNRTLPPGSPQSQAAGNDNEIVSAAPPPPSPRYEDDVIGVAAPPPPSPRFEDDIISLAAPPPQRSPRNEDDIIGLAAPPPPRSSRYQNDIIGLPDADDIVLEEAPDIEELYYDDDFDNSITRFGHLWLASIVSHDISVAAASHLWTLAFNWIGSILEKKRKEGVKRTPQFAHLRRKLIRSLCPPVSIRVSYKNTETGEVISPPPSQVNQHKEYSDIMKFQKLHEITSVKFKDVLKIHRIMNTRHQQDNVTLDLSCDGVADANSSGVTMDMITVRFPECRTVYPLVSIRPIDKTSVNFLQELDKVLSDFKVKNVKIRNIICDNPMRALRRNCKNHASYFSC